MAPTGSRSQAENRDVEVNEYLRVVRSRWRLLVLTCLVGIGAGWSFSPESSPERTTFLATHTLIAEGSSGTDRSARDSLQNLEATALIATVGEVPARVAAALSVSDPSTLVASVRATADPAVAAIRISATDPSGPRATEIANAFARELLAELAERAQQRAAADLQQATKAASDLARQLSAIPVAQRVASNQGREALLRRFETANDRLQQLQSAAAPTAGFSTLEEARAVEVSVEALRQQLARAERARGATGAPAATSLPTPARSSSEPPAAWLRMLIGGVAGAVMGAALALLAEKLDPRIRSRRQAEVVFGLPVVAEIPRLGRYVRPPKLAVRAHAGGVEAESFRFLRSSLLFRGGGVASPGPGGGTNGWASAEQLDPAVALSRTGGGGDGPPVRPASRRSGGVARRAPAQNGASGDQHPADGYDERPAPCTVLVTSPGTGEGKTTTVVNLGAALAEAGRSVLVLDFDLRRSNMARFFPENDHQAGLSEALWQGQDAGGVLDVVVQPTSTPRLAVALSGRRAENPSELLGAGRSVVAAARARADLVLVDTPPLLATSDASELVPAADAVLLVCRVGKSRVRAAARTSEQLAWLGVPVIGLALVGTLSRNGTDSYYTRRPRKQH